MCTMSNVPEPSSVWNSCAAENDVKGRVRHAAAIPEQFAVDAGSRQPGRQGTAREDVLGRQNLLVVIEEDQRTRLDMGCANRQARLLRVDPVEIGKLAQRAEH